MQCAASVNGTHPALGVELLCLLLMCLFAVGCTSHPRKQIPPGWEVVVEQPSNNMSPILLTADAGLPAASLPQARMQVFICYGWMTSNHACMRIDGPDRHTLFWDPGGGYGQHDEDIPTKYDLLLDEHALTVEGVWHYRSVGCNEPAVLMFEWPLTQEEARDLRDALVEGQRRDGVGGHFESDVPGGFCSMAVSSFLRKFASHTPLPRRWFWPHNLAKRLWTYEPARVVLFQRHKAPVVYVAKTTRLTQEVTPGLRSDARQTAKANGK